MDLQLQKLRISKNSTKVQVEQLTGVTRAFIRAYETDVCNLSDMGIITDYLLGMRENGMLIYS